MGKTIIGEEAFPKIIEQYNSGGKTAAYDYLRPLINDFLRKMAKFRYQ